MNTSLRQHRGGNFLSSYCRAGYWSTSLGKVILRLRKKHCQAHNRLNRRNGWSSAYQRNFFRLHHKFLFCIDKIFLFPRGRNFEVNKKESLSTRRVLKSSCENLNHLIVEQCIGGDLPSSPGRRLSLLQRGRNAK